MSELTQGGYFCN